MGAGRSRCSPCIAAAVEPSVITPLKLFAFRGRSLMLSARSAGAAVVPVLSVKNENVAPPAASIWMVPDADTGVAAETSFRKLYVPDRSVRPKLLVSGLLKLIT